MLPHSWLWFVTPKKVFRKVSRLRNFESRIDKNVKISIFRTVSRRTSKLSSFILGDLWYIQKYKGQGHINKNKKGHFLGQWVLSSSQFFSPYLKHFCAVFFLIWCPPGVLLVDYTKKFHEIFLIFNASWFLWKLYRFFVRPIRMTLNDLLWLNHLNMTTKTILSHLNIIIINIKQI